MGYKIFLYDDMEQLAVGQKRNKAVLSRHAQSRGVSSDLDGYRGALKREVFFHTFFCVLVRICNQTSSNQHLLVVGC